MTKLDDLIFTDANYAREYLEAQRWPNGPYCPHYRAKLGYNDMDRTIQALKGIEGKRLTYRRTDKAQDAQELSEFLFNKRKRNAAKP